MMGGVDDPVMASAILERLEITTEAPVPARARDPTEAEWAHFDDDWPDEAADA
jgi:hypothetical protein